jgi:EmrB/QacA subfamily drug resistance transporter
MTTMASARDQAASLAPRARTLAFATLTVAFVMDVLDSTIVNIAIPAIRTDLGAGPVAVQWMVAGYSMAFAMLLISGGRMGDVFGYRRMFIGGMLGFTLASLLCGVAPTPTALIVARLVQGATAACMGPQVLALVQLLYPPHERVAALSFFGVLGGLTAVLGPVIGGALIEANIAGLGWRAIFLINLPIGAGGIVAAWYLLPGGRSPDPLRIDWAGNALVVALLFALVFPLIEARALDWPWWCFGLFATTVPLGVVLWWHLRRQTVRTGSALLDPAMFQDRSFSNGLLTSLVFAVAGGGFLLVLTLVLQVGLGLDPLSAGLLHIPFAVGVGLGISLLGRRILPRLGRSVLAVGSGAMALGVAGVTVTVATSGSVPLIGVALLIAGLGMGTCAGPLSPIALARVDTRHAGAAGGALKTVQQLGNAGGAATVGTLFLVIAGGATSAPETRAALIPAAISICLLLFCVAVLSRRFPQRLFDTD